MRAVLLSLAMASLAAAQSLSPNFDALRSFVTLTTTNSSLSSERVTIEEISEFSAGPDGLRVANVTLPGTRSDPANMTVTVDGGGQMVSTTFSASYMTLAYDGSLLVFSGYPTFEGQFASPAGSITARRLMAVTPSRQGMPLASFDCPIFSPPSFTAAFDSSSGFWVGCRNNVPGGGIKYVPVGLQGGGSVISANFTSPEALFFAPNPASAGPGSAPAFDAFIAGSDLKTPDLGIFRLGAPGSAPQALMQGSPVARTFISDTAGWFSFTPMPDIAPISTPGSALGAVASLMTAPGASPSGLPSVYTRFYVCDSRPVMEGGGLGVFEPVDPVNAPAGPYARRRIYTFGPAYEAGCSQVLARRVGGHVILNILLAASKSGMGLGFGVTMPVSVVLQLNASSGMLRVAARSAPGRAFRSIAHPPCTRSSISTAPACPARGADGLWAVPDVAPDVAARIAPEWFPATIVDPPVPSPSITPAPSPSMTPSLSPSKVVSSTASPFGSVSPTVSPSVAGSASGGVTPTVSGTGKASAASASPSSSVPARTSAESTPSCSGTAQAASPSSPAQAVSASASTSASNMPRQGSTEATLSQTSTPAAASPSGAAAQSTSASATSTGNAPAPSRAAVSTSNTPKPGMPSASPSGSFKPLQPSREPSKYPSRSPVAPSSVITSVNGSLSFNWLAAATPGGTPRPTPSSRPSPSIRPSPSQGAGLRPSSLPYGPGMVVANAAVACTVRAGIAAVANISAAAVTISGVIEWRKDAASGAQNPFLIRFWPAADEASCKALPAGSAAPKLRTARELQDASVDDTMQSEEPLTLETAAALGGSAPPQGVDISAVSLSIPYDITTVLPAGTDPAAVAAQAAAIAAATSAIQSAFAGGAVSPPLAVAAIAATLASATGSDPAAVIAAGATTVGVPVAVAATAPDASAPASSSASSGSGAAAGGVMGGLLALSAVGGLLFVAVRRRQRARRLNGGSSSKGIAMSASPAVRTSILSGKGPSAYAHGDSAGSLSPVPGFSAPGGATGGVSNPLLAARASNVSAASAHDAQAANNNAAAAAKLAASGTAAASFAPQVARNGRRSTAAPKAVSTGGSSV